jgi:hypothetical protein
MEATSHTYAHGLRISPETSPDEFFQDATKAIGVTEMLPDNDDGSYGLKVLQNAVGGLIELVPVKEDNDFMMIVNEEGLLKRLRINPVATILAGKPIVGAVAVIPTKSLR